MPKKIEQFPRLRNRIVLEHGFDILHVYIALVFCIEASDFAQKEVYQALVERLFLEQELPVIK